MLIDEIKASRFDGAVGPGEAAVNAVLLILGSWSRHIVDRRTHDRQELP